MTPLFLKKDATVPCRIFIQTEYVHVNHSSNEGNQDGFDLVAS
jgi:hypothetical protein